MKLRLSAVRPRAPPPPLGRTVPSQGSQGVPATARANRLRGSMIGGRSSRPTQMKLSVAGRPGEDAYEVRAKCERPRAFGRRSESQRGKAG